GWTAAPERVAIVGGGYVAVELAGVLQALGSRVDLFVRGQRLMDSFDAELTAMLAEDYRQAGIHLHPGHDARMFEREARGIGVHLRADGRDLSVGGFDALLMATGRRPNTEGLGLDAAGVKMDERGHVRTDARNNTSAAGVFAVGDVAND